MKTYSEMKDSGVDWIGKIPEHWEQTKLKRIAEKITKGTTPTTIQRDFTDEGIKFVKAENITEFNTINSSSCLHIDDETNRILQRSSLKENDVLVTIAGVIGRTAIVNSEDLPANTNQAVGILSPIKEKVIPVWIAQSMKGNYIQNYFQTLVVQTAQANLSLEDLGNTIILIPPKNEQEQISEFLKIKTKKIKAKIEKNQKLVKLLEKKKQSLINQVVTKGLDSSVQMKDSGVEWIGKIPEKWEMKKIKSIIKCLDGRRIPLNGVERSSMSGNIPYYGASGIVDHINDYIFDEKLICLSEDGDNLRSRVLPIAFTIEGKSWVNNHAHVLRPTQINENFLVYLLNSLDLIPYLEGATRVKLNQSTMNSIPLPYPPSNEQKQIVKFLDEEIFKINVILTNIELQIKKLEEFRKSLIKSLVTGKIDVREAVA